MSTRAAIGGIVNNDLAFSFDLTYQGEPLNLTGYTITVYLKASQATPDSDAATFTPGPSDAPAGEFTWDIPHAGNTTAGTFWYRVDVTSGGYVATCIYGPLTIQAA